MLFSHLDHCAGRPAYKARLRCTADLIIRLNPQQGMAGHAAAKCHSMMKPTSVQRSMSVHRALFYRVILLLALAAISLPARADPVAYRLDPLHSRIVFSVDHDGYSQMIGSFSQPNGTLWFDPDDWTQSSLEVTVELATLDLGDADFNARIGRRDYLDVSGNPTARFVSSTVEPLTDTTARVYGVLTLRGLEQPVSLDVTLNRMARSAWTMRRTLGFSATASLHRSDFGMKAHRAAVGDAVQLRIEVEAVRASRRRTRDQHDPLSKSAVGD